MDIRRKVAVVTGGASGIGQAVVKELARRGVAAIGLVDQAEAVRALCEQASVQCPTARFVPFVGDVSDPTFRASVFEELAAKFGLPQVCVPAAGITRDALAARMNQETGKVALYPIEHFRLVMEVNLVSPIYWGLEMVGRIAEDRFARGKARWDPQEGVQGTIIFIGSVSSQGNKGQIAYAATKSGLQGAAATLMKEAIFYGVRCGVIHPGFTDTPMVRALGEQYIHERILPNTQLRRLIRPEEIADAICFMITNSAVSGELWADAGWHPSA